MPELTQIPCLFKLIRPTTEQKTGDRPNLARTATPVSATRCQMRTFTELMSQLSTSIAQSFATRFC
jgi:hypothetical protein